jgi:hypothetical protein
VTKLEDRRTDTRLLRKGLLRVFFAKLKHKFNYISIIFGPHIKDDDDDDDDDDADRSITSLHLKGKPSYPWFRPFLVINVMKSSE